MRVCSSSTSSSNDCILSEVLCILLKPTECLTHSWHRICTWVMRWQPPHCNLLGIMGQCFKTPGRPISWLLGLSWTLKNTAFVGPCLLPWQHLSVPTSPIITPALGKLFWTDPFPCLVGREGPWDSRLTRNLALSSDRLFWSLMNIYWKDQRYVNFLLSWCLTSQQLPTGRTWKLRAGRGKIEFIIQCSEKFLIYQQCRCPHASLGSRHFLKILECFLRQLRINEYSWKCYKNEKSIS